MDGLEQRDEQKVKNVLDEGRTFTGGAGVKGIQKRTAGQDTWRHVTGERKEPARMTEDEGQTERKSAVRGTP